MFWDKWILLKKGLRNDVIWTQKMLYGWARIIPLYFDTKALLQSQYWPREKMDSYVEARLSEKIRIAASIPFWKDIFDRVGIDEGIGTRRNFSKIPIVSKKDFIGHEVGYFTNPNLLEKSTPDYTSGSTGQPFKFYFDWGAELRSFAICERMVRVAAHRRYPIIAMRARHKPGFAFHKHNLFFLSGCNSVRHRLPDLIKLGQTYRDGFILYGYTSAILEVARQAEEQDAKFNIRAAIATGEALGPEQRAYIEEKLHTNFFLNYATRDLGWLGYECEYRAMHLNEEWAYIEILDERGMPTPPGTAGRIVVTPFDNRVMPFLRYDIGDRGTFATNPCPCGRTLKTLEFSGRHAEMIHLDGGRAVPLINISPAFDRYVNTVKQFQIVQTSPLSFTIKVVPGFQFESNKENLEALLVRLLHPSVRISWECVAEIPNAPSGKAIYFVRAIK